MFTLLRRLLFGVVVGLVVAHAQTGFATLAPLAGITRLAAGEGSFALALRQDGVILSWGANTNGTLGNGTTTPMLTPAPVDIPGGGADVVTLAPSAVFALALKADGTVLGWGVNGLGQLGDGTFSTRLTPVQTSGFGRGSGVTTVAVGLSHGGAPSNCELGAPPEEAPRPGRIPTIYAIAAVGFTPPPGTAACLAGTPCLNHPRMIDLSRVGGPAAAPPVPHIVLNR